LAAAYTAGWQIGYAQGLRDGEENARRKEVAREFLFREGVLRKSNLPKSLRGRGRYKQQRLIEAAHALNRDLNKFVDERSPAQILNSLRSNARSVWVTATRHGYEFGFSCWAGGDN
jgi:hypothetical protein